MDSNRLKLIILSWLRPFAITLAWIVLACLLRLWPLHILEERIAWVTFYPAVMAAALFGGLGAGVLGAVISCLIVTFFWSWFTTQPFIQGYADWLGLVVFFLNCVFISAIAEWARRARRMARQSQEQAEAANRAKSVFLANMSHELRTPLHAVLGFSRLMKNDAALTSLQDSRLDIIIQSGEHLLNLINNILDLSRIESGHAALEEHPESPGQLVEEVFTLMSLRAAEKGLEFSLEVGQDLPHSVMVDAGKLRQVLLNLVGNAVKYTPAGEVILRARLWKREPLQRVWVRFEVQDSGPGIREEDRQQVFKPFVQLEGRAPSEGSSGLGLAISRQNVELMGGQIGIDGGPAGGTLVHFEIPLVVLVEEPLPESPSGSRVRGLADGQPCFCLLVADDQPQSRLMLRQLLEPLGFEIQEAENGQQAVEAFEHWHPDLIWMDIRMPVIDGHEATRRIRTCPGGERVKIVALTAHALESERQEILASGCDDFIRKPYRENEIFHALSRHLGVVFTYENEVLPPPGKAAAPDVERLKALPAELLQRLFQAVELLDRQLCLDVIEEAAGLDRELAVNLGGMVEKMQYQELLTVLDSLVEKDSAHG